MSELKIVSLYSAQGTSTRKKGEIKKLFSLSLEFTKKKAKTTKKFFNPKESMKSNKKREKGIMRKAYNLFLHLPPHCFSCFAISPSAV